MSAVPERALRRTVLPRALHRPNLVMGGERELVLTTGLLAAGLVVEAMNLVALAVGGAVWFVCVALLRRMAKGDPQMSRVYLRQLRYRAFYPARSRPTAE